MYMLIRPGRQGVLTLHLTYGGSLCSFAGDMHTHIVICYICQVMIHEHDILAQALKTECLSQWLRFVLKNWKAGALTLRVFNQLETCLKQRSKDW